MAEDKLRGSPEGLVAKIPDAKRVKSYGPRVDNTPKGPGFFGELARTDDPELFSGELSVTLGLKDRSGKEILMPLLVPTLTAEEIAHLVDGGQPTLGMLRKAKQHAIQRLEEGKSPFADFGEQISLPTSASQQFQQGFESK
jgi:hypothetical protein